MYYYELHEHTQYSITTLQISFSNNKNILKIYEKLGIHVSTTHYELQFYKYTIHMLLFTPVIKMESLYSIEILFLIF